MKIAIGADHAGFSLKEQVREMIRRRGHELKDFAAQEIAGDDYPDYAELVGGAVARGEADRGVLVCLTGVGMSIAANKIRGVRAALAVNEDEVRLARLHNDANVLALGSKYAGAALAETLIDVFLTTEFEGGRHARRVGKIVALEANQSGAESRKGNAS